MGTKANSNFFNKEQEVAGRIIPSKRLGIK